MKDQVAKLQQLGVPATLLSNISDEEADALEEGLYSVVYGTPESWIKTNNGVQCCQVMFILRGFVLLLSTRHT